MKYFTKRKQASSSCRNQVGQGGVIHHVVPIAAFLVLFGIIGTFLILYTQAASSPQDLSPLANSGECVTNRSGKAELVSCSGSGSTVTYTLSGRDYIIKSGGGCLQNSGSQMTFSACNSKAGTQYWDVVGGSKPEIESTVLSPNECVTYGSLGAQLTLTSCKYGTPSQKQELRFTAYKSAPKPTPPPTPTSDCHNHNVVYTTALVNTYSKCTEDIQHMVDSFANNKIDGGTRITPDGYYGSETAGQVEVFQRWDRLGVDGKVGSQTWNALCTQVKKHKLNPAGNAYNDAC